MDSVFLELKKYLIEPFDEVLDFRYVVIANKVVNVVGYKKLITYSTESVVLGIKGNQLIIEGRDLRIRELYKLNIVVVGKINKVYLSKEM